MHFVLFFLSIYIGVWHKKNIKVEKCVVQMLNLCLVFYPVNVTDMLRFYSLINNEYTMQRKLYNLFLQFIRKQRFLAFEIKCQSFVSLKVFKLFKAIHSAYIKTI